jgi:hypothetical protein
MKYIFFTFQPTLPTSFKKEPIAQLIAWIMPVALDGMRSIGAGYARVAIHDA